VWPVQHGITERVSLVKASNYGKSPKYTPNYMPVPMELSLHDLAGSKAHVTMLADCRQRVSILPLPAMRRFR
jgi:hypothetical protein